MNLPNGTTLGERYFGDGRHKGDRRPMASSSPLQTSTSWLFCRGKVGRAKTTTAKSRLLFLTAAACVLFCGGLTQGQQLASLNCCGGGGQDGQVDCSTSGVEHLGQSYYCMSLERPDARACISCIPPATSIDECSSCCGTPNAECDLEWSWGAVLVTLLVSAVFATCSGVLALAEKRRKRKGMSLARAWSIPHGMPMLRATVVNLSDAVRGRASIWSVDGLNGDGAGDEDLLEQVGLLEELPNDSIYGALVEQRDSDIPVAKLAEDNWVTAMAWRHHYQGVPVSSISGIGNVSNNSSSSSSSGSGSGSGDPSPAEHGTNDESPAVLDAPAVSRWRSARAAARHARRVECTSSSVAVAASTGYRSPSSPLNVGDGRGAAGGDGEGYRWAHPPAAPAVVVVGYGSDSLEGPEGEAPR